MYVDLSMNLSRFVTCNGHQLHFIIGIRSFLQISFHIVHLNLACNCICPEGMQELAIGLKHCAKVLTICAKFGFNTLLANGVL